MRSLLDINVLIALLDSDHPHHRWAADWFKSNVEQGWASCPLTQNGCVRIMSQAGYPNPTPTAVVIQKLRRATAHESHEGRFVTFDSAIPVTAVRKATPANLLVLGPDFT